ncbi:MAG: Holliday junction branch migration protein RuvA [Candidatus Margulisbacteria bacterium]|jgi:Holliday junction DNA helicase RuvA|nr:Holliday junction branch migration protein RuvA [Candidatus Margulisiibacteriota bacterium]
MIAHLQGKLEHIDQNHVVIEVNDIGYKVNVPAAVLARLPQVGSRVKLFTSQIVREDDISLYGFLNKEERALFNLLLSVSGIGPKMAMALLSGFPLDRLVAGIAQGDVAMLSSISGVGRKKAELIIVELKEKIGKTYAVQPAAMAAGIKGENALISDSIAALIALGYSPKEARESILKIKTETLTTVEAVLREALKSLV